MSNNVTEVAEDAEQPDDVRRKRDKHDAAIKEMLDALKQARKDNALSSQLSPKDNRHN